MNLPHPKVSRFPLSDLQQGMLFHTLSSTRKSTYLVQKIIRFSEGVDLVALESAWNGVLERYDVLRSYFDSHDSYYTHQCVEAQCLTQITCLDYSDNAYDTLQSDVSFQTFLLEDANKGIDLSRAPLIRLSLIIYNKSLSYFVWTYHHALMGGPSTIEVLKDVIIAYDALKNGRTPVFNQHPGSFYIPELKPVDEKTGKHYWQTLFARSDACGQAPGASSTMLSFAQRQSVYRFKLNKSRSADLLNKAALWNVTPSTFIFAAWGLLLSRYLNHQDIVFGAVRAYPKSLVQNHVGLFINTLPIKVRTDHQTVLTFLTEIRQQYQNLDQFIAMPLTQLQRWVGTHPKEALFETFVDFKAHSLNDTLKNALGPLWVNKYAYQHFDINYAFSLEAQKEEHCFVFDLNYESNQFSQAMVQHYAQHYLQVLDFLLADPGASLDVLDLVKDKELQELYCYSGYNNIKSDELPTVLHQFDDAVTLNPNKIIVSDEDNQMPAQLVYDKSVLLATTLKALYQDCAVHGKEPIVAIFLDRCADMVVSILGIWRSGSAFLPLDSTAPKARIESFLNHASVTVVVSNTKTINQYPYLHDLACNLLNIDEMIASSVKDETFTPLKASQLAYVIYTSGTTGQPKGVMIEQSNLANYVKWFTSAITLQEQDVSCLMLPYFFDASYTNLFPALALGNTLNIPSQNTLQDVYSILEFIETNKVSYLKLTPSFFRVLARSSYCQTQRVALNHLRLIILGGEPIDTKDVALFHSYYPHVEFMNHYGPSETTIGCCATRIDFEKFHAFELMPVVGKPIKGDFAAVVDAQMRLLPKGVIGELLIGGLGVGRGYLANKELTEKQFIKHPSFPGQRLYKSGDLAHWLEDGTLKLGARKDTQIKIRGHRIDVKEIEQAILALGIATQVEFCKLGTPTGGDRLIAFIEPPETSLLTQDQQEDTKNTFALSSWAQMYNELYSLETQQELSTFTTRTWVSAYDHTQIDQDEMKEWQQAIVHRISQEGTGRILEIGCGTGLILFGLQNHYSSYFGVDLSSTAIDILKQKIQKFDIDQVQLACAAAHELHQLEALNGHVFDTIVLNSVVQYFPCLDYLDEVLNWCVNKITDIGVIIIGDVRDYRLAKAYYDSIYLAQHAHAEQDFDGRRHYQFMRTVQEKELLIHPEYFVRLGTKYNKIIHVDVLAKRGLASNELNTWRYDVVLKISSVPKKPQEITWTKGYDYQSNTDFASCFEEQLDSFYIRNVPNYRLWSAYWTTAFMEGHVETHQLSEDIITIDALEALAAQKGYSLKPYLALGYQDAPAYWNLFFVKQPIERTVLFHPEYPKTELTRLSTRPLFAYQYQNQNILKLKASLAETLPDYMIPQHVIFVPEIPLTRNGKADKNRLAQLAASTTLQTPKSNYVAPQNEIEMQLTEIWQELLRVECVGVMDDFFTLGGDSILCIQFISKCLSHGLRLQLIDFIENPTIAAVASKIVRSQTKREIRIRPKGKVLLTPVQHWFFARNLVNPHHYNQAFLLVMKGTLEQQDLEHAFTVLAYQHDSLRLRFKKNEPGVWVQYYDESPLLFHMNNYSQLDELEFYKAFNKNQSQLHLEQGPLLTVAFRCHNQQTQILIAMHHLIVDGLSWRILLEDLELSLHACQQGKEIQLGKSTDSYQQWSYALNQALQSNWFVEDYQYWKYLADSCQNKQVLTCANQLSRCNYQDVIPLHLNFSAEKTDYLIKVLPEEYGLAVHEVLFALYALSLNEWSASEALLINLEGHGRETCIANLDVCRTVGWFTSMFPVLIDWSKVDEDRVTLLETCLSIAQQLRDIPNNGIGFGLLQRLRQESVPKWVKILGDSQLKFNYLGQFQDKSDSQAIHSTMKWSDATTALDNQPDYHIFLQALIKNGSLQCEFRYNSLLLTADDMQKLVGFYDQSLHSIIHYLTAKLDRGTNPFNIVNNDDQFDRHEF